MRVALGSLASFGSALSVSSSGDVKTSDLIGCFRRNWYWIVIPTFLAFLLSLFVVNIIAPRYTAESKIILENRDSYFTRPAGEQRDASPQLDPEAVQSQVQLVMSRDLAKDAIRRLNLVGNPQFDPLADELGSLRKVLVVLGLSRNPIDKAPEERLLETYYDSMQVFPAGRSRVLNVEFRTKNPQLSAQLANTVSELYIEKLEASKKDSARTASTWLSQTIDPLRRKVAEAEAKVEDYRARNGLLLTGLNNTTIVTQQLTDLSAQLAAARAAKSDAESKAKLIKNAIKLGRAFELPDVANNELIRRLIEQRVTLRGQLALEMRTLLSEHPRIKELHAQLFDLEDQMRAAADRVVRSLDIEAKLVGSRVDSLLNAIDSQKGNVVVANENEIQLRAFEREAKANRDQLESYLIKYREALARDAENAVTADARIVSRAIEPNMPSFPKKVPTVSVITLATLFLSIGFVLGRHLLGEPPANNKTNVGAYGVPLKTSAPFVTGLANTGVTQPVEPPFKDQNTFSGTNKRDNESLGVTNASDKNEKNTDVTFKEIQNQFTQRVNESVAKRGQSAFQTLVGSNIPMTDSEKMIAIKNQRLNNVGENVPQQNVAPNDTVRVNASEQSTTIDASFSQSGQLLRYMKRIPIDNGRGRRILCIFEENKASQANVRSVLNELSQDERGIYVQLPPQHGHTFPGPLGTEQSADLEGFTDLVAGDVTFSDVIVADEDQAFHWIPAGLGMIDELMDDKQTLDVVLKALEQTYPWVLCGLPSDSAMRILPTLLSRVDNVIVVVSQEKPSAAITTIANQIGQEKNGKVVLVRSEASSEQSGVEGTS